MPSTRRRTWIPLLILAHVLCYAGIAALNSPKKAGQLSAGDAVVLGFFWAELGLLAVWAGLGRGRWIPRLGVIWVLLCLAAAGSLVRVWWNAGWSNFAMLLGMISLMMPLMLSPIVITLAVVRRRGWRLAWFPASPPVGGALQFSVRHMIALTAVVAVVMSAAYYVRPLAVFEKNVLVSPGGGVHGSKSSGAGGFHGSKSSGAGGIDLVVPGRAAIGGLGLSGGGTTGGATAGRRVLLPGVGAAAGVLLWWAGR
ncbi:hypothetical protein ACFL5Q_02910 [Planctomycetota bacterium]